VFVPPNVSTTTPAPGKKTGAQSAHTPLWGAGNQKKASFFSAFEGLMKNLKGSAGSEKQVSSSAATEKTASARDHYGIRSKEVSQKPYKNGELVSQKLVVYKFISPNGSKLEQTGEDRKRISSTLIKDIDTKDAEVLKKQQNLFAKENVESSEKNNRNRRPSKTSDADQNVQMLAGLNSPGVQPQQTKVKAEKNEATEEGKEKRVEKSRDRRKERIDVEVYDLRTQTVDPKTEYTESNKGTDNTKTVELTLHLKEGSNRNNSESTPLSSQAPSRSFQDMLAQELRTSMNGDIVRHASMVLKDGGEGLIRLNLKPESLGNVRIKLEMADNRVTGHILVETEEALRAFEKEIHSLEQAFKDGGFQGASLEVSVSADGRGSGAFQQGQTQQQPFYSERLAANTYDVAMPDLIGQNINSPSSSGPNVSINMLA
jgi:flagellar hook-length control protein FliK